MHTSLRHYAITVERNAQSSRSVPAYSLDRAEGTRRHRRSFLDRIPSIGRVSRRPAFG
jgi:hypothetical protein